MILMVREAHWLFFRALIYLNDGTIVCRFSLLFLDT